MVIGFHCVTSAKYDQTATLLRQGYDASIPASYDQDTIEKKAGQFVMKKHPITGERIPEWSPVMS